MLKALIALATAMPVMLPRCSDDSLRGEGVSLHVRSVGNGRLIQNFDLEVSRFANGHAAAVGEHDFFEIGVECIYRYETSLKNGEVCDDRGCQADTELFIVTEKLDHDDRCVDIEEGVVGNHPALWCRYNMPIEAFTRDIDEYDVNGEVPMLMRASERVREVARNGGIRPLVTYCIFIPPAANFFVWPWETPARERRLPLNERHPLHSGGADTAGATWFILFDSDVSMPR